MITKQHFYNLEITRFSLVHGSVIVFAVANRKVFVGTVARSYEIDYIDSKLHASLRKEKPQRASMKIRNIRKELPKLDTS
jgi:hypothetical protein